MRFEYSLRGQKDKNMYAVQTPENFRFGHITSWNTPYLTLILDIYISSPSHSLFIPNKVTHIQVLLHEMGVMFLENNLLCK